MTHFCLIGSVFCHAKKCFIDLNLQTFSLLSSFKNIVVVVVVVEK